MEDSNGYSDLSSTELDIGAHLTPMPFVSLRIGYLKSEVDYESAGGSGSIDLSGFYLGGGIHW